MSAPFRNLLGMQRTTFCGTPLGDYTHDELVQLLHGVLVNRRADLAPLVNLAMEFNARRRADDLITGLPFITRRKGGGHDTAAR